MCKVILSFPLVFVWAFIVIGVTPGFHASVGQQSDAASNLHSLTSFDQRTGVAGESLPTGKEPDREFARPDNIGAYFSALFASNYKEMEIVARSHVARAEKAKDNFKKAQFLNLLGTAVYWYVFTVSGVEKTVVSRTN